MKTYDHHMHTTYSDGVNSVEDMVKMAIKIGLNQIAITDHIWRSTEWFDEYKEKIISLRAKNLNLLVGFEAKALSINGEIDATQYMCDHSDIKLGAIHRIPSGKELNAYLTKEEIIEDKNFAYLNWLNTTINMIKNRNVDIIAHPLMALDKYNIKANKSEIIEIMLLAKQYNTNFEISTRYKKSNQLIFDILSKIPSLCGVISYGSDAHSAIELQKAHR